MCISLIVLCLFAQDAVAQRDPHTSSSALQIDESLAQWQSRSDAPLQALHAAHRMFWLVTSVFHPFKERMPPTTQAEPILTALPVPGALSSPFGERDDPVKRRRRKHHKGVDFVAQRGTHVQAAGPGIIVRAQSTRGYGRIVVIDHGLGLETRYAHLQRIKVKKGEFVPSGMVIGTVGSSGRATGPHLHFEVRQDGVALPPETVTNFKIPACSAKARDCRRDSPKS